jgi:hypothetical protein
MSSTDCTILDAGSPLMAEQTDLARKLFNAGMSVATKLRQPGETYSDHVKQALSHALQGSLRAAGAAGATDDDMFVGMVVAVGWLLRVQTKTANRVVYAERLINQALMAARMGDAAALTGFETAGDA